MSTEIVEVCDLCRTALAAARPVPGLEDAPIAECAGCGLATTTPRPTPEALASHYPDSYYAHVTPRRSRWSRLAGKLKAYRGGYPAVEAHPARTGWRLAARLLGGFFLTGLPYRGPGRRVLDIGCGNGDALDWAREHGWEVHGVEPDAEAVAHAQARGLTRVRVGSVEEQGYPAGYFDAITLYQVLEHVYSPTRVLRECHRILKPGGEVFVSVPNFDSIPRKLLGVHWYALQVPIHLHHFTPATLARLAEQADFTVSDVRYYSRLVSLRTTMRGIRSKSAAAGRNGWPEQLGALAEDAARWWSMREGRLSDIMLFVLRKQS